LSLAPLVSAAVTPPKTCNLQSSASAHVRRPPVVIDERNFCLTLKQAVSLSTSSSTSSDSTASRNPSAVGGVPASHGRPSGISGTSGSVSISHSDEEESSDDDDDEIGEEDFEFGLVDFDD
jgi:hypothetical protein